MLPPDDSAYLGPVYRGVRRIIISGNALQARYSRRMHSVHSPLAAGIVLFLPAAKGEAAGHGGFSQSNSHRPIEAVARKPRTRRRLGLRFPSEDPVGLPTELSRTRENRHRQSHSIPGYAKVLQENARKKLRSPKATAIRQSRLLPMVRFRDPPLLPHQAVRRARTPPTEPACSPVSPPRRRQHPRTARQR